MKKYIFISLYLLFSLNISISYSQDLLKDDGIADNFHKKHLGKIVFSKKTIPLKGGKESQLTNKFNVNTDNICFRAFYKQSFHNMTIAGAKKNQAKYLNKKLPKAPSGKMQITFEVEELKKTFNLVLGDKKRELFQNATSFSTTEPLHDAYAEELDEKLSLFFYNKVVSALEAGEYKVKMTINFYVIAAGKYKPKTPVAVGEFTLISSDEEEANSDGTFNAQAISDDIHKKYNGKIVFSKNLVPQNDRNENELSKKFILDKDDIYFMAFLKNSMHNRAIKDGQKWIVEKLPELPEGEIRINFKLTDKNGKSTSAYHSIPILEDDAMLFQKTTAFSLDKALYVANEVNYYNEVDKDNYKTTFYGTIKEFFIKHIIPNLKEGNNKIKISVSFVLNNKDSNKEYKSKTPLATDEFIIVKKSSPIIDNGLTCDLHKKNKGKIVFSKNPIPETDGKVNQLSKKFTLGTDNIYCRIFLERSHHNQCIKDGKSWIKDKLPETPKSATRYIYFEVNGKIVGKKDMNKYRKMEVYKDDFQKTTNISFKHSLTKGFGIRQSSGLLNKGEIFLSYVVPNLKQGNNKVKMFVNFSVKNPSTNKEYTASKPVASGEFNYYVDDLSKIKTTISKPLEKYYKRSLISKQNNEALIKEIKSQYKGSKKLYKIVISDSDWRIIRNRKNNIVSRYMFIDLIFINTNNKLEIDGYFGNRTQVSQTYMGGGKYGKSKFYLAKKRKGHTFELPAIIFK